ncbi:MAG: redoxin domain-containing protein [Pirellulales bacterium]
MPKYFVAAAVVFLGLAGIALADEPAKGSLPVAANDDALVGRKLDGFTLRDQHGNPHALADYQAKKAVALVYLGTECPLARLYAPRLAQMARDYAAKEVAFLGVDANVQDTPTELVAFANMYQMEFPLLIDAGNALADKLGATRTPEVFLLDAQGVVRYHGRIDDQYVVGATHEKAQHRDLATAIDELVAGQPVATPSTKFTGCLISKVRKIEPHGEITYSGNVAAIINRHCVECHREGELAPFPLATYDDVAPWADTIREVVSQHRMPPWFADPAFGKFTNDCSMSADDTQTLLAWIDNGCPQGNPADVPPAPEFYTGWRMGEPDLVYEMEKPYTVPAEGTVEYQYFTVGPKLEKDLWVSIAECRPGNARVVHHVVLFAVPPGEKLAKLEEAQGRGQMIGVYAPGMNPWRYPAGTAMKIVAGSTLVIQMHYTPNGFEQSDKSMVALKLLEPDDVKQEVRYGMVVNPSFEIPPHAENHVAEARKLFLKDSYVLNLFPHMHYRGKSFKFEAEFPDGRREVLLNVPHYDFNWQLRYDLAKPVFMPKGSRLVCTAVWDNSDANPLNPDPSQTVRFGLQSWEEMMVGYYTTIRAPVGEETARAGE